MYCLKYLVGQGLGTSRLFFTHLSLLFAVMSPLSLAIAAGSARGKLGP